MFLTLFHSKIITEKGRGSYELKKITRVTEFIVVNAVGNAHSTRGANRPFSTLDTHSAFKYQSVSVLPRSPDKATIITANLWSAIF